jgi:hypothetical protein
MKMAILYFLLASHISGLFIQSSNVLHQLYHDRVVQIAPSHEACHLVELVSCAAYSGARKD